ncbi:MAG: hypothetical protein U0704_06990 [Candidatus Eisenbacteria bacterium]
MTSLLLALSGCSKSTTAVQPAVTDPAPPPNTPAMATTRIAWDWNRRDPSCLDRVTADFEFVFASGDSAAQRWQGVPWTREVESIALQRMFDRSTQSPRLVSISLTSDRAPVTLPDPRPGKNPRFHKIVRTQLGVLADLDMGSGTLERRVINGSALFFFVRGDSAAIPHDLVERGVRPDSTVWWLQRWEDETLGSGMAMHPNPAMSFTLGGLKSVFVPLMR